jgi:hypothetical protein
MDGESKAPIERNKKEPEIELIQWYTSTLTDWIFKMTLASVLFFTWCPWAAFFWPPYYFMKRCDK